MIVNRMFRLIENNSSHLIVIVLLLNVICSLEAGRLRQEALEAPEALQAQSIQKNFSCEGRPSGYYADVQSGCEIYHMCDGLGRQFSYSCPNTTLFQQRMLICDHWYMVNCNKSEKDFDANLLIGQREKPFVEDNLENPYHRTPRPDLLAHPSAAEYNIVYRTGRAQRNNNKNLVGADTDYDENNPPATGQPAYFLPSHWSTNYYKTQVKTESLQFEQKTVTTPFEQFATNLQFNRKIDQDPYKTGSLQFAQKNAPPFEQSAENVQQFNPQIDENSIYKTKNLETKPKSYFANKPKINFESNYKATTPVYPKIAPPEAVDPYLNLAVGPNHNFRNNLNNNQNNPNNKPKINFESNYKATTPVYPNFVEPEAPLASEEGFGVNKNNKAYGLATIVEPPKVALANVVNFASNYKATTPVYPRFVEAQEPLATQEIDSNIRSEEGFGVNKNNAYGLATIVEPPKVALTNVVNFASNYKATTPVYPSFVEAQQPLATQDLEIDPNRLSLSKVVQPPKSYVANNLNTVNEPSIYYQAPLSPVITGSNQGINEELRGDVVGSFTTSRPQRFDGKPKTPERNWKELRRVFLIPDFDFPLDASFVRPGYDEQGPNSFQVNPSYVAMPRTHA